MKLPLLLITVLSVTSWSIAADKLPVLTKTEALRAITLFREDPLSEIGRGAGGLIMNYAEKSPDVRVVVSQKCIPFLSNKGIPINEKSTLIAAFVVGNVDSQLLRNQKKDDSYAGVLQVIDSYRQIQREKPKFRLEEIEKFIELEKRGQLKAYVSSK